MFISAKDKLSKAGEPAEKVPDVKSVQSLKSKDPKVSGAKWRGGLETIQGKGRPEIAAHLPTAHLIERSKKEEKVAKRESLIQEMKSESFLPSTFKNWIHRIKRAKKLAPDPILRTSKKDIRGRPPKTPSWKDFLSGISNLTVMKEYRRGQYPDLKRLIEGDKPPTNLTRAQFKDLKEWYKPWYVQNKKEAKKSMFISAKDKLSKAKKGSLSHNEDQGAEYKLRTRTLRYLGLTRNQLTDAERQMTTRDLWNLHKDKKRSFFLYRKKALKGAKYSPHGRSATWTPEKGYVQPSKVIKKKKSKHERLVLMPLAEIATSGDMTSKQRKEWAEDVKNREGGKLLESFSGLKTAAGANKLLRETRKYTKKPTIADRLHTLYEQPPAQTKSKKVETKEKSMFISAKDKLSKAVKNPKAESAQKMFESIQSVTGRGSNVARRKPAGPTRAKTHQIPEQEVLTRIKGGSSLKYVQQPKSSKTQSLGTFDAPDTTLRQIQRRGLETKVDKPEKEDVESTAVPKVTSTQRGPMRLSMFISAKDSLNKSVLTTEDREDLKQKQFALPKKAEDKEEKGESGNYPIPDLSHARNALAMVAQHGSSSEQARVRAAVYKKYPELDKRKEEEQEKSIFISAQDSLSKAVTDKTPKARVGYPAVTHERTTAQETDLVSVYDEAGKLVYRGSKAGAPKVGQPVIPREVVSADSGGYEVVSVADAKKRRAQKAQQTLQTAKGANRLFKEMQQYANQKPKLPYQLGDFAKQKEARVKTKGVPVKTKEVPEEARVKTKGVPVKTKEVPEEVPFVKSLDPVLAARMNMKPMSVPGAVGHPSIGQIGFHNTTIAANFYTNSEVTLGEKTLPVLKRPNR